MGETELVLDTLGVDEALKLIAGQGSGTREEGSGKREAGSGRRDSTNVDASADWRAALRAAGASPDALPAATQPREASAAATPDAVPASRFTLPASPDAVPASREAPEGI